MTSHKLLLLEDSTESKDAVLAALGSKFEVDWSATLREARTLIEKNNYDLLLLDIGLPDGDGFLFFSMLKNEDRFKTIPIIFLTARGSTDDKVLGISMGADDYIVKPFSGPELKARAEMRIKKNSEILQESKVIHHDTLELNLSEQRAYQKIENQKKDLQLTPLEFKILTLLLSHEEQIFSRDQVLTRVWGQGVYQTDRSIDTHIYSLRQKLGALASRIQSVYGQGYRFSGRSSSIKSDLTRKAS